MYKILVLKNRVKVPVVDDFQKAIEYFKRRNIDISFEFKEIDTPVSVHYYKVGTDGARYYGIDDYVKDSCDKHVPKGQYHSVIFAWNTDDVQAPNDGIITSWTNWSPLTWVKADTEFIQLITNEINDKIDWIYKSIIHEIMHTLCKRIQRRGLYVIDEMDITTTNIPYYKNGDPEATDGNFARTFENLKPHMSKIYDFYFISQEKPPVKLLKFGDRNESVRQLQSDLKELGYFTFPYTTTYFGPVTLSAVKAFQKANGLSIDGVVGPKTLAKLDEVKKKPKLSLIDALIKVESNGNDYAIGDATLKNKAYGCLQIRQPACDDVNRWFGTTYKAEQMLGNRTASIDIFNKYMSIYKNNITDEDKARAWNGGGNWKKIYRKKGYERYSDNLDKYWSKVSRLIG